MIRSRHIACHVAVLLLYSAITAYADTHYVSWSGNSTPPYTSWQTAAWFVESANEVASTGDTIRIDSGDFTVSAPIYLKNRAVVIGRGRDSTRVIGFDGLFTLFRIPPDSATLRDLAIIGNSADNALWAQELAPFPLTTSLTIERCHFSGCRYEYVYMVQGQNLVVRDCSFLGFGVRAIWVDGGGGGYATGTYTIDSCIFFSLSFPSAAIEFREVSGSRTVTNSEFYPTFDFAIHDANGFGSMHIENNLFMSSGGGTLALWCNADSLSLINNSFYRFDRFTDLFADFVHIYRPYVRYCNIVNNIFQTHYDNGAHTQYPVIAFFGSNPPLYPEPMVKIRNNCLWANRPFGLEMLYSGGGGTLEIDSLSGNFIADPMFVAPPPEIPLRWNGTHDLHLQFGSPCIDSGLTALLDVDGSRSDLGAFGGPNGASYSYQDLPPKPPAAFAGAITTSSVIVRWQLNAEADLSHYALYRGTQAGFPKDAEHLIASIAHDWDSLPGNPQTDSLFYTFEDTTVILHSSYYYCVIAVDEKDNASESSVELAFTVTDSENEIAIPLPTTLSLEQNYPNPFNAETKITYFIPEHLGNPVHVVLSIHNILGQEVKLLIDSDRQPGPHAVLWNGTANTGETVASGIYLYSLSVQGTATKIVRKMLLIK